VSENLDGAADIVPDIHIVSVMVEAFLASALGKCYAFSSKNILER